MESKIYVPFPKIIFNYSFLFKMFAVLYAFCCLLALFCIIQIMDNKDGWDTENSLEAKKAGLDTVQADT